MQLRGLHHVTAICRDLERTIAFYRDLLGLAIVHDGPSDDDPDARHVWFGALDGGAGHARVSFMEYPELPEGVVGRRLHAPLRAARRLAPTSRRRGATTCATTASSAPTCSTAARSARSTCAIPTATSSRSRRAGRASAPAGRPRSEPRRRRRDGRSAPPGQLGDRVAGSPLSRPASAWRWRSVIEPIVLVSDIGIDARNRRQRVRPQRCWLISRSAIAMLSASHGHSSTISATVALALGHLALELGARQPHAVGLRERPHVLRRRGCRSCVHRTSPLPPHPPGGSSSSLTCTSVECRARTSDEPGARRLAGAAPPGHVTLVRSRLPSEGVSARPRAAG